jgi:anti-sigma factor RsiW
MTCRQLVELVTAYFDGVLPEDTRAAFEEHLRHCSGCNLYLEQMRTTIRLARDSRQLERRPEVSALLAEFRDWKAHRS